MGGGKEVIITRWLFFSIACWLGQWITVKKRLRTNSPTHLMQLSAFPLAQFTTTLSIIPISFITQYLTNVFSTRLHHGVLGGISCFVPYILRSLNRGSAALMSCWFSFKYNMNFTKQNITYKLYKTAERDQTVSLDSYRELECCRCSEWWIFQCWFKIG